MVSIESAKDWATTAEELQRKVDRSIRKAASMQGWFNWYLDRGRVYGFGKDMRSSLRRVSWRRAH